MIIEKINLVEATDHTGYVHRFCTSDTGYTSLPTDTPPNAYYAPRVIQPGLTRQNMFAKGTTSGSSTGGKGDIILRNSDGGLDGFVDLGFDGQLCVVRDGSRDMALSQFATVISGTVEQPETSWNNVTFLWRDNSALLDTPIQTLHYLGNNVLPDGIEGGAELKDKPKPRVAGNPGISLTPVCVNTAKLVYQVHAYGPLYDIPAVHVDGNVGQIIKHADCATSAELLAVTLPLITDPPTIGIYITCLAEGLFRLDGTPTGTVTCEAIEGATPADRTAGQIIKALASEKLGAENVAVQPILDLDTAAPYEVGIYTGTNDMTYSQALDLVCGCVGAWWGFDNLSIFWAKQLTAPLTAQIIMTVDAINNEFIKISRVATADSDHGVPAWRVFVDYSKNWTVQASGLTGRASAGQLWYGPDTATPQTDRFNLLSMEYIRTKAENASVLDVHKTAPTLTIKTTLNTLADAAAEAARTLALRSVRRDRLVIELPTGSIQYPPGGYWDDEAITDMPITTAFAPAIQSASVVFVGNGWGRFITLDLNMPTVAWGNFGQQAASSTIAGAFSACVVFGTYIYSFGGGIIPANTAGRVDVTGNGTWDASVTDLPDGRSASTAIEHGGIVYCIGGLLASTFDATDTVISLDLSNPTGAWSNAESMSIARYQHTATKYYSEYFGWIIIVVGGDTVSAPTNNVSVYSFNGVFGTHWFDNWIPPLPEARSEHYAAIVNDWLYVIGGKTSDFTTSCIRLNLAQFNFDTIGTSFGNWEYVTDIPVVRAGMAGVGHNNSIFVFGGNSPAGQKANSWKLRTNESPEDKSQLTSLGRTILVKHPRDRYAAGWPMKIIGTETNLKNQISTLEVWG